MAPPLPANRRQDDRAVGRDAIRLTAAVRLFFKATDQQTVLYRLSYGAPHRRPVLSYLFHTKHDDPHPENFYSRSIETLKGH